MKATELMIGDWILMDGHKLRVTKLTADRDYDNCEPIPLSAEILEKNGFKNKPTYSVYHSEDDRTEITIYYNSGVDIIKNNYLEDEETFSLPFVCYVHELQHALRLCGLTDMADNFQLPELPKEDTK